MQAKKKQQQHREYHILSSKPLFCAIGKYYCFETEAYWDVIEIVVDFQSLRISRSVHRVPQALFGSELFVHSGLLRTFESSALEMYYLFILTEKNSYNVFCSHFPSVSSSWLIPTLPIHPNPCLTFSLFLKFKLKLTNKQTKQNTCLHKNTIKDIKISLSKRLIRQK